MADVYEQNLASKSTLTTTDYIRVVGSDNVSYKQLVSDVAKKIIENYTGSTLAGSAQSVKSAVDSLNSKTTDAVSKVSSISGGTLDSNALIKVGSTVFASARLYSISETANGNFFTVPAGFRPSQPMRVMGYFMIGGVLTPLLATVNTDGTIYFGYSSGQTTTQVGFSGSWTVA